MVPKEASVPGPANLTATVNPDGRIVLRWEAPDSLHGGRREGFTRGRPDNSTPSTKQPHQLPSGQPLESWQHVGNGPAGVA